ncbi:MAG: restriction endonuclease subunit S [Clostridiales bacterium]|nr:restriction endonuclease subunit S [Clostridiales bacterium]
MARQMKDSGIEWIGEIPETWEIVRIGSQYTERRTKVSDTEYPPLSVTMKGIMPQLATAAKTDAHDDRKLVCVGDFAINSRSDRRGSCGISAYDGSVSLINTILCPRDEMNPQYYDWLFHSTMFSDEFYKWGHGIVDDLWTTNWQDMKRISIPEPPFDEQHRIAAFLDRKCAEIDAVIERTKATIEEYKKLKQAVITEAVTKGVRGPRPMKDSGVEWLGSIPDAWDYTKLKQVWVSVDSGVSVNAADYPTENDTQYGVLKTSCVSKFVFLANEHKQVDAEEYARVACPVKKDTIIVSRMNTPDLVGACGYVDADYPNLFLPDRLWQISFFPEVSAKFVWYYLNNQMVRAYISSLSTGTSSSMQNISKPQFGGITLAVPTLEEQDEIVTYLDEKCAALDTLIAKKTALLTELETYKKSLIYEYVTGKKEVL